jgi:hypothetical protein
MSSEAEANQVSGLAASLIDEDYGPVAHFFAANGVAAPKIAWDPSGDDAGANFLGFLVEFWRRGRGGAPWPPESAIDPVDLRPALGSLLVCEPLEDLSDFRIRLYGSRLAQSMGRDLTGAHVSDIDPGSYITTFYLACYRAVAIRGAALFTRHNPSKASFASEINRLLLPFGPEGRVSRILVGVDSVARRPLGRPNWTKQS